MPLWLVEADYTPSAPPGVPLKGSLGSKKGLIIKKDFFPELQWGTGTVRVKDGWLHKDHPKGN